MKKTNNSKLVSWLLHKRLARTKSDAELRLIIVSTLMLLSSFYITTSAIKLHAKENVNLKYGTINQALFRVKN